MQSRARRPMMPATGNGMRLASETFGNRLKAIRVQRGLSQVDLSTLVGKSRQTISAWENSIYHDTRLDDVRACAQALHCRTRALLEPLDKPLPALPPFWLRIRRQIKQHAAARSPWMRGVRGEIRKEVKTVLAKRTDQPLIERGVSPALESPDLPASTGDGRQLTFDF